MWSTPRSTQNSSSVMTCTGLPHHRAPSARNPVGGTGRHLRLVIVVLGEQLECPALRPHSGIDRAWTSGHSSSVSVSGARETFRVRGSRTSRSHRLEQPVVEITEVTGLLSDVCADVEHDRVGDARKQPTDVSIGIDTEPANRGELPRRRRPRPAHRLLGDISCRRPHCLSLPVGPEDGPLSPPPATPKLGAGTLPGSATSHNRLEQNTLAPPDRFSALD